MPIVSRAVEFVTQYMNLIAGQDNGCVRLCGIVMVLNITFIKFAFFLPLFVNLVDIGTLDRPHRLRINTEMNRWADTAHTAAARIFKASIVTPVTTRTVS